MFQHHQILPGAGPTDRVLAAHAIATHASAAHVLAAHAFVVYAFAAHVLDAHVLADHALAAHRSGCRAHRSILGFTHEIRSHFGSNRILCNVPSTAFSNHGRDAKGRLTILAPTAYFATFPQLLSATMAAMQKGDEGCRHEGQEGKSQCSLCWTAVGWPREDAI